MELVPLCAVYYYCTRYPQALAPRYPQQHCPTYEGHMRRVEGAVAAEKQLLDAAALGAEEAPEGVVEGKVLQLDDAQRQL